MTLPTVLAVVAALAAPQAVAPQSPQARQEPEATVDSITVIGERPEEAARDFVDAVATSPAGARLARWTDPVCVSAAGLRAPYGQMLVDRIASVALDLDLEVGEPGCRPNVLIIATDDGPTLATALVDGWRQRFRPAIDNTNMGLAALDRFETSDAPIRWWHIALPRQVDSGELAARVAGGDPPILASRNPSRMRSSIRHDLNSVTVVIDLSKTEGVMLSALMDYAAMVALAQIDPRADYSRQPTVLNLFGDPQGVRGLTDWDRDYLQALYSARNDRATAAAQEAEVSDRLVRLRRERSGSTQDSSDEDADDP